MNKFRQIQLLEQDLKGLRIEQVIAQYGQDIQLLSPVVKPCDSLGQRAFSVLADSCLTAMNYSGLAAMAANQLAVPVRFAVSYSQVKEQALILFDPTIAFVSSQQQIAVETHGSVQLGQITYQTQRPARCTLVSSDGVSVSLSGPDAAAALQAMDTLQGIAPWRRMTQESRQKTLPWLLSADAIPVASAMDKYQDMLQ